EYEHGGFVLELHDEAPAFGALVGVAGTEDEEAGDCAKACELFDGLMRWAVFADADGVVCEDVYGRDFHYRGEAYAAARVVGEDEEAGAVGAKLREREAVQHRRHLVLAYAEVEVATAVPAAFGFVFIGGEAARAVEGAARLGRGREVCRAADEPGDDFGNRVQDFCRSVSAREAL